MIAAFGAPEAAPYLAHLRHGEDLGLDHVGDTIHLLKRGAGRRGHGDERSLLLEGRQEVLPHFGIKHERGDHAGANDHEHRQGIVEPDTQRRGAQEPLQARDKPPVCVRLTGLGLQEKRAEDWYQRQGYDKRSDHADDGGDGDGSEELTLNPAQAKQRKEDQDDQNGGVENRAAHFA